MKHNEEKMNPITYGTSSCGLCRFQNDFDAVFLLSRVGPILPRIRSWNLPAIAPTL